MKRILHCVPGSMNMGGIETFLMNVYRNIDRSNIQFDFIVHSSGKNYFEDEIKQLGGHIYKLPNKSHNFHEYKKQFINIIKQYSIIHIHSTYAFTYFEAKWAFKQGLYVILHSHNSNANLKRKLLHRLLKFNQNKYVNLRIAPSKQAAQWMFPKNEMNNIFYLYNGFNTHNFYFNNELRVSVRQNLGVKSNTILLGCVARLDWQKDPFYTLNIFNELAKEQQDLKLVFIGTGSLEAKLKQQVTKYRLRNKVIFTGNISNSNEYLNGIDIFILPTRYEGLGIALVEAQLNGLPVVTNMNIPKEAVINDNVYLISKKYKSKWVQQIKENLNKGVHRRKINLDAFSNYNISTVAKQLEDKYLLIESDV